MHISVRASLMKTILSIARKLRSVLMSFRPQNARGFCFFMQIILDAFDILVPIQRGNFPREKTATFQTQSN